MRYSSHLFYFICITTLICQNIPAKENTNHLFAPNKLRIRLKNQTTLQKSVLNNTYPQKTLGIPLLDAKLQKYHVHQITNRFQTKSTNHTIRNQQIITFQNPVNIKTIVQELKSDPNIEWVEPVPIYKKEAVPNDPHFSEQHHLKQIEVIEAWEIHKGEHDTKPIIIAITDDAVDWTHEDLAQNIWQNIHEDADGDSSTIEKNGNSWRLDPGDLNGIDDDSNGYADDLIGWDFDNVLGSTDNDPGPDNYSSVHGTHVAGIAAAITNNGVGIAGVNWNGARIMALKHDSNDDIYLSGDPIQGVLYAAENGANIINMSWGSAFYSKFDRDIIEYAASKGCILVASAGNEDNSDAHYPSDYPHVIAVGAVDSSDKKAFYSSFGPGVDVMAPGGDLSFDGGIHSLTVGGYTNNQGTSMAAPLVSGLIGLIKSTFPHWSNNKIMEQLFVTADDIDSLNTVNMNYLGNGRINAFRALQDTLFENQEKIKMNMKLLCFSDEDTKDMISPDEEVTFTIIIQNYSHTQNIDLNLTMSSADPDIIIMNDSYQHSLLANSIDTLENIFKIKAADYQTSHEATCKISATSNKIIAADTELDLDLLLSKVEDVYIWEPLNNHQNTSGQFIYETLKQFQIPCVYSNQLFNEIELFKTIFLCFDPSNRDINFSIDNITGTELSIYYGNNIYIEGVPKVDDNYTLFLNTMLQKMGIDAYTETVHEGFTNSLTGESTSFAEGMVFTNSLQPDQTLPGLILNAQGNPVFMDSERRVFVSQCEENYGSKSIYSVYALSGFRDNTYPNTRKYLLSKILGFFELLPDTFVIPDFIYNQNTGHAPLTIQFKDQSFNQAGLLNTVPDWDFNFDWKSDSKESNPSRTFSGVGTHSISLTQSWNNITQMYSLNDFISVFNGNSALQFNGVSTRVIIPSNDAINLTGNFTMTSWIYPTGWGETEDVGFGRILDKDVISIFLNNQLSAYYPDQSLVCSMDFPNSGFSVFHTSPEKIKLNKWQHIAVTYNTLSKNVNIYIDGVKHETIQQFDTPSGPLLDNQLTDLWIGNRIDLDRSFEGIIDELTIWDQVLSDSQIKEIIDGEIQDSLNMIACWPMNDGQGEIVHDVSGNGNHGQLRLGNWTFERNTQFDTTSIDDNYVNQDLTYQLYQNYPNPFNAKTSIKYSIPTDANVTIRIFDIRGRMVSKYIAKQSQGLHIYKWPDKNSIASGVYIYVLNVKNLNGFQYKKSRKMVYIK